MSFWLMSLQISFAFSIMGLCSSIATTFNTPLTLGGPASVTWCWILGATMCFTLGTYLPLPCYVRRRQTSSLRARRSDRTFTPAPHPDGAVVMRDGMPCGRPLSARTGSPVAGAAQRSQRFQFASWPLHERNGSQAHVCSLGWLCKARTLMTIVLRLAQL